jgi:hypothetical protein
MLLIFFQVFHFYQLFFFSHLSILKTFLSKEYISNLIFHNFQFIFKDFIINFEQFIDNLYFITINLLYILD